MSDQKRPITDARRQQQRESYYRNQEARQAIARERYHTNGVAEARWLKKHPGENYEDRKIRRQWGITGCGTSSAAYQRKRMELMAGRPRPELCETCGRKPEPNFPLCFDHCHILLRFRGWICRKCNWILGLVEDDPKILDALAVYLREDGNV
jgi:hypothetical protein